MARTKAVTVPETFNVVTTNGNHGSALTVENMTAPQMIAWAKNNEDIHWTAFDRDGDEVEIVDNPIIQKKNVAPQQQPADKPKRTRRTRAEIAADKAKASGPIVAVVTNEKVESPKSRISVRGVDGQPVHGNGETKGEATT